MAKRTIPVSYTHLDVYKRQLHGLRHGHVGRKKKILEVVVLSLSADLYVLAMLAMVLILNLIFDLILLVHCC